MSQQTCNVNTGRQDARTPHTGIVEEGADRNLAKSPRRFGTRFSDLGLISHSLSCSSLKLSDPKGLMQENSLGPLFGVSCWGAAERRGVSGGDSMHD
jgi:hypothetical protein